MLFIQLVGDQLVYDLIFEIQHENLKKFKCIFPPLRGFHTEAAFITTTHKQLVRSGLEDLEVAAGIVEAG